MDEFITLTRQWMGAMMIRSVESSGIQRSMLGISVPSVVLFMNPRVDTLRKLVESSQNSTMDNAF
jgi:hypothetical protein